MYYFIIENLGTIVVGALITTIVVLVILKIKKDKNNGKTSCGCNCNGCGLNEICRKKNI